MDLNKTTLRLAGVIRNSIVDGPGIRMTVFTQGCPHKCEGCHNPDTHDINGGYETTAGKILSEIEKDPLLQGVTFSGGEPFLQAQALALLAKEVHIRGLNIITYTGYTFEELLDGINQKPEWSELLNGTDILIDGRFVLSRRTLMQRFKGSDNQRIIDVKNSLAQRRAVIIEI